MDCKETQRCIHLFLKDELDWDTAQKFVEHVRSCNECMEELTIEYLLSEGMSRLENADDIDEGSHVVREVSESAEMSEIVRLDDVIREKVTFIKMDIEGEELEALKGGAEIIKNYKPKLAISVYHKLEDLVEIPRFIMNLDSTYKLYLRHYWNCSGTDTILFAI